MGWTWWAWLLLGLAALGIEPVAGCGAYLCSDSFASPGPTSSSASPEPTSSSASPEPTSSSASPEPTSSSASPEPTSSSASPEPTSSSASPEPTSSSASPEPTYSSASPEPTSSSASPEPTSSSASPEPTSSSASPEPTSSSASPEPTSSSASPEPTYFSTSPEPTSSSASPEPTSSSASPEPTSSSASPEPTSSSASPEPTSSSASPEPTSSSASPEPTYSSTSPEPTTSLITYDLPEVISTSEQVSAHGPTASTLEPTASAESAPGLVSSTIPVTMPAMTLPMTSAMTSATISDMTSAMTSATISDMTSAMTSATISDMTSAMTSATISDMTSAMTSATISDMTSAMTSATISDMTSAMTSATISDMTSAMTSATISDMTSAMTSATISDMTSAMTSATILDMTSAMTSATISPMTSATISPMTSSTHGTFINIPTTTSLAMSPVNHPGAGLATWKGVLVGVGSAIGLGIVLTSIIIGICCLASRRKYDSKGDPQPLLENTPEKPKDFWSIDPNELGELPPIGRRRNMVEMIRRASTRKVQSKPVTLTELESLVSDQKTLEVEFASISRCMTPRTAVPLGAENKNRYMDVVPNPHTRVGLFLKFGVANSDYINANYIQGQDNNPKAYIATQGPLPWTVVDFWRMVWEQKSCIIIMAADLKENGTPKCAQYWPDERVTLIAKYDDFEVRLNKKRSADNYTVRTLQLKHIEKGVCRDIFHFWFTSWPDSGVLHSSLPLIKLLQEVRVTNKDVPGPLVVHCSAGVGRTGVIIGVDMGMHQLEEDGKIDVLGIVSSMRQDRGGMVQTLAQYIFLHETLLEYGRQLEQRRSDQARPLELCESAA